MVYGSSKSGKSKEKSDKVGCRDIYNRSTELVLVLLSNLYFLLELISVGASGPSSYLTLHYLLITSTY